MKVGDLVRNRVLPNHHTLIRPLGIVVDTGCYISRGSDDSIRVRYFADGDIFWTNIRNLEIVSAAK